MNLQKIIITWSSISVILVISAIDKSIRKDTITSPSLDKKWLKRIEPWWQTSLKMIYRALLSIKDLKEEMKVVKQQVIEVKVIWINNIKKHRHERLRTCLIVHTWNLRITVELFKILTLLRALSFKKHCKDTKSTFRIRIKCMMSI